MLAIMTASTTGTAALGLDVANQRPDCEGPHPLGATAAWAPP